MAALLDDAKAQVYDRQIRLWGLSVQERLCSSKILILGCSALHLEAAKNIILSGVHVSLCPGRPLDERLEVVQSHEQTNCLCSTPLVHEREEGPTQETTSITDSFVSSLRQLNSLCSVQLILYETFLEMLCEKTGDSGSLLDYAAVLVDMWSLPEEHLETLNRWCRSNNRGFFFSQSLGVHGAFFLDLATQRNIDLQTQQVRSVATYPSLKQVQHVPFHLLPSGYTSHRAKLPHHKLIAYLVLLRQKNESLVDILASIGYRDPEALPAVEFFKHLQCCMNYPFPPTSAVVGGMLANAIQLYISGGQHDFYNIFLFDGHACEGLAFNVQIETLEYRTSQEGLIEEFVA